MHTLSHSQWFKTHAMTCEIHRATTISDLIHLVIHAVPRLLDIGYTVWHERSHDSLLHPARITAQPDYLVAIQNYLPEINTHLHTHPIVQGLDMQNGLELPAELVTTRDFASAREIQNTAIYHEAYRHLEIENHAVLEIGDNGKESVMICVNTNKAMTPQQRAMTQIVRDHLDIAYNNLRSQEQAQSRRANLITDESYQGFSKREKETLPHLLRGKTNVEIAVIMGISHRTVEKHVASIIQKAGAENRKTLIAHARQPSTPS